MTTIRPLKDLIKPISHEALPRFIPMVMLFGMLDTADFVDYTGHFDMPRLQIDDEWNHCLTFEDGDQYVTFSYGRNSFSLMVNDEVQTVSNQLLLFKSLMDWGFIDLDNIPKF